MTKFFTGLLCLMMTSAVFAQKTTEKVIKVKDVETLNDQSGELKDKKVSVIGHVKRVIGPKSIVIEGGGLLNDDIVVSGDEIIQPKALKEGAKIEVTGFLRVVPVVEVGRRVGTTGTSKTLKADKEVVGSNSMIMWERIRVL